jgi:hypothetical protein
MLEEKFNAIAMHFVLRPDIAGSLVGMSLRCEAEEDMMRLAIFTILRLRYLWLAQALCCYHLVCATMWVEKQAVN